jgi:hypothetical protein
VPILVGMKHLTHNVCPDLSAITQHEARALGVELDHELELWLTMPLEALQELAGELPELREDPEHGGRAWRLEAPQSTPASA